MSEKLNLPFQPPVGFENAVTSLENRAKDDDLFNLIKKGSATTELWLIQAPLDLDITEMDGNKLNLTGEATRCKLESNCKEYELWPRISNNAVSNSVLVLKPDSQEEDIKSCLKSFSGNLSIVDYVSIPKITIPEVVNRKMKIPEGLRQRYVPFGSSVQTLTTARNETEKSKKRKSEHESNAKVKYLIEDSEDEMIPCIKEEVQTLKTLQKLKKDDSAVKIRSSRRIKSKKDDEKATSEVNNEEEMVSSVKEEVRTPSKTRSSTKKKMEVVRRSSPRRQYTKNSFFEEMLMFYDENETCKLL